MSQFRLPSPSLLRAFGAASATALVLAGCALGMRDPDAIKGRMDASLVAADQDLAKGDRDKALSELMSAARENPTRVEPWLRIANIRFDAGDYPSSIVAANEALQRDGDSQEARSLLVVASLRIAASAVTDLRKSDKVGVGSRVEAEDLTKALRRMLGEDVLVPPPTQEAMKSEAPVVHVSRPQPRRRRLPRTPRKPATHKPDPFAALK